MQSSMANSSATRIGGLYSARLLPRTMSAASEVRLARAACHQIGRRHDSIGIVVVLIDTESIEPGLVGELQLVQVFVVELVSLRSVKKMAGHIHPYASVLVLEIRGQIPIRHQVKPANFHCSLLA